MALKNYNMKTISRLLILILIVPLLVHTGCEPDEYDDPDVDYRSRYTGNWMAEETSTQFPSTITYSVKIFKDADDDKKVLISNFYHLGNNPGDEVSTIVTSTSLTIPQQTVCGLVINGSGLLSGNTITWEYYVNDGADVDHVTGTYTKIN